MTKKTKTKSPTLCAHFVLDNAIRTSRLIDAVNLITNSLQESTEDETVKHHLRAMRTICDEIDGLSLDLTMSASYSIEGGIL